jgi:hypothetical protein
MMNEAKARAALRGLVAAAVMASAAQGCCSSEEHRYVRPETAERPFHAQWTCRDACYEGPRCPFGDNETLESCELTGAPGQRVATCVFRTVACAERPFSGSAVCGRRMDGSGAPRAALRAAVGARLASMAVLEREASAAFVRLARELRAHGAPRSLVARAVRAAWQERRHTRAVSALAARYGAEVPRWFPRVGAVRALAERIIAFGISLAYQASASPAMTMAARTDRSALTIPSASAQFRPSVTARIVAAMAMAVTIFPVLMIKNSSFRTPMVLSFRHQFPMYQRSPSMRLRERTG